MAKSGKAYKALQIENLKRETLKACPIVHSRLQAASYTAQGQDWQALFDFYDRNKDGLLQYDELKNAIRKDLRIPPAQVSDYQVRILFNALDSDGGGNVELAEFVDFLVDGPASLNINLDSVQTDDDEMVDHAPWETRRKRAAEHLNGWFPTRFRGHKQIYQVPDHFCPPNKQKYVDGKLKNCVMQGTEQLLGRRCVRTAKDRARAYLGKDLQLPVSPSRRKASDNPDFQEGDEVDVQRNSGQWYPARVAKCKLNGKLRRDGLPDGAYDVVLEPGLGGHGREKDVLLPDIRSRRSLAERLAIVQNGMQSSSLVEQATAVAEARSLALIDEYRESLLEGGVLTFLREILANIESFERENQQGTVQLDTKVHLSRTESHDSFDLLLTKQTGPHLPVISPIRSGQTNFPPTPDEGKQTSAAKLHQAEKAGHRFKTNVLATIRLLIANEGKHFH